MKITVNIDEKKVESVFNRKLTEKEKEKLLTYLTPRVEDLLKEIINDLPFKYESVFGVRKTLRWAL